MVVQPAARELLQALVPVLGPWGPWYVFGAQAVVAYGIPRLSADVDVTIRLTPDAPERFVREMDAAGFVPRVSDRDFIQRTRVIPFVHSATGMPLDVVLAGSGLEDEFLARARMVDLEGVSVPFLDLADLVTVNWRYAAAVAARIFAWGGASDEAMATLEALDAARPGLCPAEITHDPLYQVPLERHPRYELLRARLEREMHAVGSQRP